MKIIFEEIKKWDRARIRVTLSFANEEIRFKISKGSYKDNHDELTEWATNIYNEQNVEGAVTLRSQIDLYANMANFYARTNKARRLAFTEELPSFLVYGMRDLFEAFCAEKRLKYEFDRTVIGYENLDTYKAYTIFKYSNNWRESK